MGMSSSNVVDTMNVNLVLGSINEGTRMNNLNLYQMFLNVVYIKKMKQTITKPRNPSHKSFKNKNDVKKTNTSFQERQLRYSG